MLQLCLLLLLGIQQILASQNPYHQSYQPPSPPPPQHSSSNQGEGVGERQTSDSFKEEQQPIQYASHQNAPQREGGDTHVPRGDVYPPHRPFVSGADPNSNPRYPPHPQQHPQQHPHAPPGSMGGIRSGPGEVPGSARGFGEGALTPYGFPPPQRQPQAQDEGGLFSKLKSSIFAAGNALSDTLQPPGGAESEHSHYPQQQQGGRFGPAGYPGPAVSGYPQQPRQQEQDPYPRSSSSNINRGAFGPGPVGYPPQPPPGAGPHGSRSSLDYPPPPHRYPPQHSRPQQQQPEGGGLFGKIKNFFGAEEGPQGPPGAGPSRPFPPSHPRVPPMGAYGGPPRPPGGGQFFPPPPPPPPSLSHQGARDEIPHFPPSQYPNAPQQGQGQGQPYGMGPAGQGQLGPSTGAWVGGQQQLQSSPFPPSPPPPLPPQQQQVDLIPPEPQAFAHGDCVVMVLRPQELFKKQQEIRQAGPGALQVFADFEHVITGFKTADGERAAGSAELLENSGAVQPAATQQLSAIAEDFEKVEFMDEAAFEDLTARCQQVVARDGGLHIASVAPVTRDLLPRLGLRAGWAEALRALAEGGVPSYVFSSGYGDVVAQALLQGLQALSGHKQGQGQGQQMGGSAVGHLPQNLRIVSNFFRTAPDGTVRAFSQPIVHERNKNASTAAAHMGFTLPSRPYALVLGSHEDDVTMTDGLEGLKEQVSVGFLELTDDLPQRLPLYLSTFDAVVVGDGSFSYVRRVLDELLGNAPLASGPTESSSRAGSSDSGDAGTGATGAGISSLGLGLRSRLGLLLNSNPQQQQSNPQQQHSQQQQQRPSLPQPPGYAPQPGYQQQYEQQQPYPGAAYGQQQQFSQHPQHAPSYLDFTEF